MPSLWVTPGLRFNDWLFSEPVPFAEWMPPACAGLAVILVRDPNWAPKPFRPLYFAEFGNGVRGPLHAPAGDLYVAALPMPFSTSAQRRAARSELISAYNPAWQAGEASSCEGLAGKLDQIMVLLAHLAKLFEPQPVGPHRPIGFRPEPVTLAAQGES
jgi:hypothetical protein